MNWRLATFTFLITFFPACARTAGPPSADPKAADANTDSKVALIDGTKTTVGSVQVVELIPNGMLGYTMVLGTPVPLESPIRLTIKLPEGTCDLTLTGITRIGPAPRPARGSRAAEYALAPPEGCDLKPKATYHSSKGQVRIGTSIDRLQPFPFF